MILSKISLKVFALAVFALILAACSAGGSGDPLNGTAWQLASIDGAAAIPGTSVTAAFAAGQVSGSGGCNSYGGSYQVSGDKLTTGEIASTMMACADQGAMDQETAFLGALGHAQSFTVSGDKLEITTSDGKTMVLTRQP